MISYPSSFQSSRLSDKENVNPNSIKVKATGFSPLEKEKATHHDSVKCQQFLSVYQTIRDIKNEASSNSMKTLLQGFCSTIEETQENAESQNFINLAIRYFGKGQLNRRQIIQLCRHSKLYSSEQISLKLQGKQPQNPPQSPQTLKQILSTNLGQLIIEQFCHTLKRGQNITKQQQKIIQILIPESYDEEINCNVIMEHYDILKSQMVGLKAERRNLAAQFRAIRTAKIEPKLWSDHFRLEISKMLNYRQERERLSYDGLNKCLGTILTPAQISTVFRHIYALQTNTLMPILDKSKTISLTLLKANLLHSTDSQINSLTFEPLNPNFSLQQSHKRIQKLQAQQKKHLQLLSSKDKEIERLNRIIQFMGIEKEEDSRLRNKNMEIQLEACKRKYEGRIEGLMENNREQAKLTQWYQMELEAIMDGVNKENVMRRYLANKF